MEPCLEFPRLGFHIQCYQFNNKNKLIIDLMFDKSLLYMPGIFIMGGYTLLTFSEYYLVLSVCLSVQLCYFTRSILEPYEVNIPDSKSVKSAFR